MDRWRTLDLDGDGHPEVVTTNGSVFWVFQLVGGQGPGRPEAGRLTQLDNGYGAETQLSYTSAKEHTDNPLPFPENVVTGVTVTGANNLGGSLAGSRFAYGNGSLVFDSALVRFVFPGYGRSVQVELTPPAPSEKSVGQALITDRAGLEPFSQVLSQHDRWVREKRVGQVIQAMTLHGLTITDPWSLLNAPVPASNATSERAFRQGSAIRLVPSK